MTTILYNHTLQLIIVSYLMKRMQYIYIYRSLYSYDMEYYLNKEDIIGYKDIRGYNIIDWIKCSINIYIELYLWMYMEIHIFVVFLSLVTLIEHNHLHFDCNKTCFLKRRLRIFFYKSGDKVSQSYWHVCVWMCVRALCELWVFVWRNFWKYIYCILIYDTLSQWLEIWRKK